MNEGWAAYWHARIIRELHTGELVEHQGEYYDVPSARIWDLPDEGVQIAVAVGGEEAVATLAPLADHLIATEPDTELIATWNGTAGAPQIGGGRARAVGQIPICWDTDEQRAVERAHEQFRWFAGGWAVNADLPTTAGFAGATQFVRPEDVAEQETAGAPLRVNVPVDPAPAEAQIERAVEVLEAASAPVVLAGPGVARDGAMDALVRFSDRLHLPARRAPHLPGPGGRAGRAPLRHPPEQFPGPSIDRVGRGEPLLDTEVVSLGEQQFFPLPRGLIALGREARLRPLFEVLFHHAFEKAFAEPVEVVDLEDLRAFGAAAMASRHDRAPSSFVRS